MTGDSKPRDLSEEARQDSLYRVLKTLVGMHGEYKFRERPTEQGDANKPVVDRLREAGFTVTFEPMTDAKGGFWVVTK